MGKRIYDPLTLDEHQDIDFNISFIIDECRDICDKIVKKYNKSTDQAKNIEKSLIYLQCLKKSLRDQAKIDQATLKDKNKEWNILYEAF